MCTQPWPLVRKNWSLSLFHEISLTSKWNCCSARILWVRVSMNVIRSSLLPTAMVLPSGDHVILIFSPLVLITVGCLFERISQMRTVLSPLAVLSRSGCDACQHNWSTDPVWPRNVTSFAWNFNQTTHYEYFIEWCDVSGGLTKRSRSKAKIATDLSNDPEARRRPSQFQPTECTLMHNKRNNICFQISFCVNNWWHDIT